VSLERQEKLTRQVQQKRAGVVEINNTTAA
jgi:hypothetical protein